MYEEKRYGTWETLIVPDKQVSLTKIKRRRADDSQGVILTHSTQRR